MRFNGWGAVILWLSRFRTTDLPLKCILTSVLNTYLFMWDSIEVVSVCTDLPLNFNMLDVLIYTYLSIKYLFVCVRESWCKVIPEINWDAHIFCFNMIDILFVVLN
jgi:hypothetical protein